MAFAECYISWHVDPMGARALTFLDSAAAEFKRANVGHDYAEMAIYPATFLLRHGLECFAKQMTIYHAYEYRNASLLYDTKHGVLGTWSTVREYTKGHSEQLLSNTDLEDGKYVDPMNMDDAFAVLDDAIGFVDKLDPDGTMYRYAEHFPKVNGKRVLKYRFPRGIVDLGASAALCLDLVEAADITMTARQNELAHIAHERRGHPGVYFENTVRKHYSDPSHWYPFGISPGPEDSDD